MNPGAIEEAGSTARTFVDAMKSAPATLAMIVANFGMLVFLFYALSKGADLRDKMLRDQTEYQKFMSELLSKCVVPPRT